MLGVPIESFEDRWELADDVGKGQELFVQLVAAGLTEPHKGIQLVRQMALAFNDQSDGIGWALR